MSGFKNFIRRAVKAVTGFTLSRDPLGNVILGAADTQVTHVAPATLLLPNSATDEPTRHEGLYGYLRQQRLKAALARYRINLVIDVGANRGQFGTELRALGYAGRIVSFEPAGKAFEALRNTAAADAAWTVLRFALGRSREERELNVADEGVFSSFLATNAWGREHFGAGAEGRRKETVSVRRLDEVLREAGIELNGARIFLKLDTQGFDLEAFEGARGLFGQIHALQSEIALIPIYEGMPHFSENLRAYESAGFAVAGLYPVNTDAATLRVIECDCLLVNSRLP